MKMETPMTAKEMARLARWLKAHGHNDSEAIDCLNYIAGEDEEVELHENGKEKVTPPLQKASVT